MKTAIEIEHFLVHELKPLLSAIPVDRKPDWGSMSVQQMVEHLAWPFRASNGKLDMPLTTEPEKIERVKQIGLMNDRPMQRNFDNPVFTAEYRRLQHQHVAQAIEALMQEVHDFIDYFSLHPQGHTRMHNIFGPLNRDEWFQFHEKHIRHHLLQFGVTVDH